MKSPLLPVGSDLCFLTKSADPCFVSSSVPTRSAEIRPWPEPEQRPLQDRRLLYRFHPDKAASLEIRLIGKRLLIQMSPSPFPKKADGCNFFKKKGISQAADNLP